MTLSEPVLITGITILPAEGESERRQVFKAWARDLNTPTSARFTALFGPVTGPCEAAPVGQVGLQLGFSTGTTAPCLVYCQLTSLCLLCELSVCCLVGDWDSIRDSVLAMATYCCLAQQPWQHLKLARCGASVPACQQCIVTTTLHTFCIV